MSILDLFLGKTNPEPGAQMASLPNVDRRYLVLCFFGQFTIFMLFGVRVDFRGYVDLLGM